MDTREVAGRMDEFKKGDLVVLKSGGPDMTVDNIGQSMGGPMVRCIWFAGSKIQHGRFDPASLQLAENDEE